MCRILGDDDTFTGPRTTKAQAVDDAAVLRRRGIADDSEECGIFRFLIHSLVCLLLEWAEIQPSHL